MNPDVYQPLVENFRHTLAEFANLHQLLEQERDALAARRIDQIKALAEKKKDSVNRIQKQTSLSNGFLESSHLPGGGSGLETFFAQLDDDNPATRELREYRRKIGEYLNKCKALNESNGASIELMNRHTHRAIDILKNPGNQSHNTYGPDGSPQKTPATRARTSV